MAFLLSPKSGGGGVTYTFITVFPVSINGGEEQIYNEEDNPGTVAPGDVITTHASGSIIYKYFANEGSTLVTSGTFVSPYTVEAVAGATALVLLLERIG